MKILVFSDSHGRFETMAKAVEAEGKVDMIIHAGDVVRDAEDLEIMFSKIPVAYVRGNNDMWEMGVPDERFFTYDGVKIFVTHGHTYGVKYSSAKLLKKGTELGADICIFGHTHQVYLERAGKVTLFNPGSAASHYGVIETNNGEFDVKICDV